MAVFRKSSIGLKAGLPAIGVGTRLSPQEVEKRRHPVVCLQDD